MGSLNRVHARYDAHKTEAAAVGKFGAGMMSVILGRMTVIKNYRVAVCLMVLRVRHRNIHRHRRIAHHGGEQYAQGNQYGEQPFETHLFILLHFSSRYNFALLVVVRF